jgi:hypothetical protein
MFNILFFLYIGVNKMKKKFSSSKIILITTNSVIELNQFSTSKKKFRMPLIKICSFELYILLSD